MANSKVSICNISLALVGADSIRDFLEDNKRARLCDTFYDQTRNYLLSKFDWPFARGYATLNEVVLTDIPEGMKAYAIPSDCMTPRDMHPRGSKDKWEVMGPNIWLPEGYTSLYYTKKFTDAAQFSETFVSLLSLALAVKICPPITKDIPLTEGLFKQYLNERMESWESDANIGNTYREYDENPNNDSFVYPDGLWEEKSARYKAPENV